MTATPFLAAIKARIVICVVLTNGPLEGTLYAPVAFVSICNTYHLFQAHSDLHSSTEGSAKDTEASPMNASKQQPS